MFVATVTNQGFQWFMRGTTWTSQVERADTFPTVADAEKAVTRTKPFTRAKLRRHIRIMPR